MRLAATIILASGLTVSGPSFAASCQPIFDAMARDARHPLFVTAMKPDGTVSYAKGSARFLPALTLNRPPYAIPPRWAVTLERALDLWPNVDFSLANRPSTPADFIIKSATITVHAVDNPTIHVNFFGDRTYRLSATCFSSRVIHGHSRDLDLLLQFPVSDVL